MLEIEIASQQHFPIKEVDSSDYHLHCNTYIFLLFRRELHHLRRLTGCALSELIQLGCSDSEL